MNAQGVDLVQSPKAAIGAAAVAGGTGLGTFLNYIPAILGSAATGLSIVMMIFLIRLYWIKSKKALLEIKGMEEESRCRQDAGLPCRRKTDNP